MERIAFKNLLIAFPTLILLALPATGDTVLWSAPPRDPNRVEQYPESRFGQGPARPSIGIGRSYASKAVEEMESDSGSQSGNAFGSNDEIVTTRSAARRGPAAVQQTSADASAASATKHPGPPPSEFTVKDKGVDPVTMSSSIVRKGVQEVAVIAGDLGFFPKTIFVTRDVPVRLFVTGASKNTLCIMMDSFQIRKQVRSQKIEEITFTPSTPGKYRYYCPVNGMEGTLVVKEFTTTAAAAGE